MASTSWKTLTQACHENLWLGFLVVVSLLFEDGLQVYDVKTITLPMPWRRCCLAWPLGKREHKQLLHQNLRALASLHLQQTINPMFLSIITSYIALKEAKQSRQTQGSPTGLQHDANVASRHDRSARLMVLDHWSIPLYLSTPLCYVRWSVPLYPTIADLHLTAHVE